MIIKLDSNRLNIKIETLKGLYIQLEPMNESYKNDLYQAAQDERIWTFNGSKAYGDQFQRWFAKALQRSEAKQHIP